MPSTDGPATMPAMISSTTAGSCRRGNRPSANGTPKAIAATTSRFVSDGMALPGEHQHAAVMQRLDVGGPDLRVDAGLDEQAVQVAMRGDVDALDAVRVGRDRLAVDVSEAAGPLRGRVSGERAHPGRGMRLVS